MNPWLYKFSFNKRAIIGLFRFLDWALTLNPETAMVTLLFAP